MMDAFRSHVPTVELIMFIVEAFLAVSPNAQPISEFFACGMGDTQNSGSTGLQQWQGQLNFNANCPPLPQPPERGKRGPTHPFDGTTGIIGKDCQR